MDALNIDQNLTFGTALQAAKQGKQIARKGWNGKNMFVWLNKGSHDFSRNENHSTKTEGIKNDLFNIGDNGTATRLPNLNMQAATGSTVTGWLASQTDLLAEDWNVID